MGFRDLESRVQGLGVWAMSQHNQPGGARYSRKWSDAKSIHAQLDGLRWDNGASVFLLGTNA